VNEFDGRRRGIERSSGAPSASPVAYTSTGDALAAGERAVAHGFEQARRGAAVDVERAREHALDALLVRGNAVARKSAARRGASALVGVIVVLSSSSANDFDGFLAVAREQDFDLSVAPVRSAV
jgi:hypothetical protein